MNAEGRGEWDELLKQVQISREMLIKLHQDCFLQEEMNPVHQPIESISSWNHVRGNQESCWSFGSMQRKMQMSLLGFFSRDLYSQLLSVIVLCPQQSVQMNMQYQSSCNSQPFRRDGPPSTLGLTYSQNKSKQTSVYFLPIFKLFSSFYSFIK